MLRLSKEDVFDKESLIKSKRYREYIPELKVVLNDDKHYTLDEVDKLLQKNLKAKG